MKESGRIIVDAKIDKYFYYPLKEIFDIKANVSLRYSPFQYAVSDPSIKSITSSLDDTNKVKWIIYSDSPIKVIPPYGQSIILNPGDSLHISYIMNYPIYSGNKLAVCRLLNRLMVMEEETSKPHRKNSYNANTLDDFMEWNKYLDYRLNSQLPIIELFRNDISILEYKYYSDNLIGKTEDERIKSFNALYSSVRQKNSTLGLTNLIQIWDSTQNKPSRRWMKSLSYYCGSIYDYYSYAQMEVCREFGFDFNRDSLRSNDLYTYLIYKNAKQNYKGQLRERLMTFILDEETITEMGLKNPMTKVLLKDYYNQPGFPEYKKYVRELESKASKRSKT